MVGIRNSLTYLFVVVVISLSAYVGLLASQAIRWHHIATMRAMSAQTSPAYRH